MRNKLALGIDISREQISMALLKRSRKGVKVLKADSASVPDGVINNGNIEQPEILAKAIRDLKSNCSIRTRKAALSLSTDSTIIQILNIPRGAPSNIGQFVKNELKSFVALSGKRIAFDYCGIKSDHKSEGRLLAVASDRDELSVFNKVCNRAHLDVQTIEPPILGYIRAVYSEKIEGRFDRCVLIVVLHGGVLALCVFRKQALDFVRFEAVSKENEKPDELYRWIVQQINTLIQYYDLEITDSTGKWEVTIIADAVQLPQDADTFLKEDISGAILEIRTDENASRDMKVDLDGCEGQPSALAIGLAMGLLGERRTGLKVNLLPPESADVKSVKRQFALTSVIIIVLVPLLMLVVGAGLTRLADKTKNSITDNIQNQMPGDLQTLFEERQLLERQIELLSKRPGELKNILGSRPNLNWAKILDDIRSRTPEAVRITAMHSTGDTEMVLQGLTLSYDAARSFVKLLNESDYIGLASLVETRKGEESGGLVIYTIDCDLVTEQSKS